MRECTYSPGLRLEEKHKRLSPQVKTGYPSALQNAGVKTYKPGDWSLRLWESIPDAEIAYKPFGGPESPAIIYPSWYSGCLSPSISRILANRCHKDIADNNRLIREDKTLNPQEILYNHYRSVWKWTIDFPFQLQHQAVSQSHILWQCESTTHSCHQSICVSIMLEWYLGGLWMPARLINRPLNFVVLTGMYSLKILN